VDKGHTSKRRRKIANDISLLRAIDILQYCCDEILRGRRERKHMEQDFFTGAEQSVPVGAAPIDAHQGGGGATAAGGSSKHPIAVFFHLAFKIAAIVLYIVIKLFTDSFILSFIVIVLLLAADFWTVKNVTGRLLVGLRWWHYVKDDGTNVWMFESSKNPVNAVEAVIFCTPPPVHSCSAIFIA
jgi:hypothetical protein